MTAESPPARAAAARRHGRTCRPLEIADRPGSKAQLEAVSARICAEQPNRFALCLSGGAIRSAIFGPGILQGLAKHRFLGAFDYLWTVSGGGYVGGWLTASIAHHPEIAATVFVPGPACYNFFDRIAEGLHRA